MKYSGYIMVLLYWNMLITYLREALNAIANVLKGNNFLYPRFENYDNFWLVKTSGMKKTYSRVLLGHITGCN